VVICIVPVFFVVSDMRLRERGVKDIEKLP
jgi:hypothetical protein